MDTQTENRFNRVEYLVDQLQKDIKRLDSRVDGANGFSSDAKIEMGRKINDLDGRLAKLSKDLVALQKRK